MQSTVYKTWLTDEGGWVDSEAVSWTEDSEFYLHYYHSPPEQAAKIGTWHTVLCIKKKQLALKTKCLPARWCTLNYTAHMAGSDWRENRTLGATCVP